MPTTTNPAGSTDIGGTNIPNEFLKGNKKIKPQKHGGHKTIKMPKGNGKGRRR